MPRRPGVPRWAEALVLVVAAVCVAAVGAPLGLLWSALSPRAEVIMTDQGGMYDLETETFAAADGRLAVLTAATGLVAAIVCWVVLRRYRGPLLLVVLALGGAGCALLTAWVGGRVGLADFDALLGAAQPGWRFPYPLRLGARGAIVLAPLFAVLTYTVLAGFSRYPALRARRTAGPAEPELVDPVRLPLIPARNSAGSTEPDSGTPAAGPDHQPGPAGAGPADDPADAPTSAGSSSRVGPDADSAAAPGAVATGGVVAGPAPRPDDAVPGIAWPAPPPGPPVGGPPPPAFGAPGAAPDAAASPSGPGPSAPRRSDPGPSAPGLAGQGPSGPGSSAAGPSAAGQSGPGPSGPPAAGPAQAAGPAPHPAAPDGRQGPDASWGAGSPVDPFAPDGFPAAPAQTPPPAPMDPVDWPDAPRRS
ncbi:hypothetical protein Athai_24770 [Actinocatenispora thailandica]|uniref:DUF2567 domain-containing protein n=2 Tax=Actinocatenispora thailandica TaxID=227318 RepID=A0A7R7DNF9_9ACTN|nr:hypothetical protein Athai_24770 [Actinocatenispora thailandica]